MATNPIPEGYHTVTPYLAVGDAAAAIAYYERVFGAKERVRMDAPGGKIGHAELEIGDSLVMLSDSFPPVDDSAAEGAEGHQRERVLVRRRRRCGRKARGG